MTKTRCWHMPASSHIALSCLVCSRAISRQGHPTPLLQAQHGRTSKPKPEKAATGFLKFALVKPYPKKDLFPPSRPPPRNCPNCCRCNSHKPFNGLLNCSRIYGAIVFDLSEFLSSSAALKNYKKKKRRGETRQQPEVIPCLREPKALLTAFPHVHALHSW